MLKNETHHGRITAWFCFIRKGYYIVALTPIVPLVYNYNYTQPQYWIYFTVSWCIKLLAQNGFLRKNNISRKYVRIIKRWNTEATDQSPDLSPRFPSSHPQHFHGHDRIKVNVTLLKFHFRELVADRRFLPCALWPEVDSFRNMKPRGTTLKRVSVNTWHDHMIQGNRVFS